jgi:hypothetical protein
MTSVKAEARKAGWLYLLLAVLGPINLMIIPRRFHVVGNATATAANLVEGESLYRLGILAGVAASVVFLFVGLALYQLFRDVDRRAALAMLVLVVVSVAVGMFNVTIQLASLAVLSGADFLAVIPRPQLDALALLFLRIRSAGVTVDSVFWGLWLVPFGLLVIRSGWFPRVLGVMLFVAGAGYMIDAAATIAFPSFARAIGSVTFAMVFGELPIILWLAIAGAQEPGGDHDDYPPGVRVHE